MQITYLCEVFRNKRDFEFLKSVLGCKLMHPFFIYNNVRVHINIVFYIKILSIYTNIINVY